MRQRLPLLKLPFFTPASFPSGHTGSSLLSSVVPVYHSHLFPSATSQSATSLAGWRNINMLNNLMKVHVLSCTHTHPRLHSCSCTARTEPRWQTRAHATLKYHLINGQTDLMRTHLHLIIIILLHFSKSVTLLHLDSSPAITRRHFIKLH